MGRPKGALDKRPLEERFWAKVEKTPRCWVWNASLNNKGYGIFQTPFERLAHRYSWRLNKGRDPGRKHVLHNCDNPRCVRPAHLRLGTQTDNMRDVLLRDRHHGRSKLNRGKVRQIRALLKTGSSNLEEIAIKFGITKGAVGHIKYGVTWKWLS